MKLSEWLSIAQNILFFRDGCQRVILVLVLTTQEKKKNKEKKHEKKS